jgi:hypothetical protein
MTGCLSYRPQKGQKGTFWTISALEHSKVFGHLQFNYYNFDPLQKEGNFVIFLRFHQI